MKIPIQNIYYLLLYAWDKLDDRDIIDVDTAGTTRFVELFGRILTKGITHLLKRGLDRGYCPHEESIRGIRGKLELSMTAKQNLLIRAQTYCGYDDLQFDILHNQILKTTLHNLIRVEDIDKSLRESLVDLYRRLNGISEIRLTNRTFGLVQLHRNNQFYDFLLKVCQLIYTNLLIDEATGQATFRDFVRDEQQMAILFQHFVTNFYKREQKAFTIKCPELKWQATPLSDIAQKHLPIMKTDMVLQSSARTIVIDTKYYIQAFQHYRGDAKVRSAHLYQLYAYLANITPTLKTKSAVSGILLYPVVQDPFDLRYELFGYQVIVRSLDLNQSWQQIHKDLVMLIA